MNAVIQVVKHLTPGMVGIAAVNIQQFSALRQRRYIVCLEGTMSESLDRWPDLKNVVDKLIFLDAESETAASVIRTLVKLLRTYNASVVHTHQSTALYQAGIAARLAGVKTIIHSEHDNWLQEEPKHPRLLKMALSCIHPVVVTSGGRMNDRLQTSLSRRDITTIPYGVDIQRFQPGNQGMARLRLGLPTGVKIIGTAGRLIPEKRHHLLIHALSHLPENVHLTLAGEGALAQTLHMLAIKLSLSHRVHFMGHVENMPEFYQALDLFCITSEEEDYPVSPLEAQACGIPAALTDMGACSDVLCPLNGIPLNTDDERTLIYQIHAALLKKPGISPRRYILQHHDVRPMAEAYDALCYQENPPYLDKHQQAAYPARQPKCRYTLPNKP
ncbi:glycosyltransferase [Photobacterium halotolerans]|uniref:Glycosyltransferase n=1 Tax=Photobacterium halotolerans TaxID=265726 RepID=A0A7X5AT31_9GAMM|nr:glycosyltransferase [Photobacterium halotolerans]NAW66874.1 glycosyltransferase [Photobacterium halotolerans]NAW85615.1 glycosyltransferase [Photobacterium halotolerans]